MSAGHAEPRRRRYMGVDIEAKLSGWYVASWVPDGGTHLRTVKADTLDGVKREIKAVKHKATGCPYPEGYCTGRCRVCGRHNAWGCGHE